MCPDPFRERAATVREHGARVTGQRVSVRSAPASRSRSADDAVVGTVRDPLGQVSRQAAASRAGPGLRAR
jgi:hypothetical protein